MYTNSGLLSFFVALFLFAWSYEPNYIVSVLIDPFEMQIHTPCPTYLMTYTRSLNLLMHLIALSRLNDQQKGQIQWLT